ncbi:hypothetical protein CYMTET_12673 [Cymbomonas tetramitiformis]|uniref:Uncharacterized protein n=1 Tax=Cymbomonas tetramitiformis TaxID=36881 RepID=A0AAE0GJM9_9CHLO|nr:hypothetical protein CYMTET_12673 [Cymbomonas tetramitiformis]
MPNGRVSKKQQLSHGSGNGKCARMIMSNPTVAVGSEAVAVGSEAVGSEAVGSEAVGSEAVAVGGLCNPNVLPPPVNADEDSHVKSLSLLFEAAPWFDVVNGINYPTAHLVNHGIADKFLKVLLPGTDNPVVKTSSDLPCSIPTSRYKQLEQNIENVVTVSDINRPPKRITAARSQWTYDDTAWQFGVYLPLVGTFKVYNVMKEQLWEDRSSELWQLVRTMLAAIAM